MNSLSFSRFHSMYDTLNRFSYVKNGNLMCIYKLISGYKSDPLVGDWVWNIKMELWNDHQSKF